MNLREDPVRFDCAGETLYGILARPERPADIGVVIVVGGPQTRVGSHRQFVLLSRALAEAGYPVLRFDVRGMGDSSGALRNFEQIGPDIAAAIDTLQANCPDVRRIVLWGLCDAASAALLYYDETHDPRIAGLILLNPWVRSEATLAKTQVKHYYGQRLLQKEFWMKLFSGRLNVVRSLGELMRKLGQARAAAPALGFQQRMARGWKTFAGPILLVLSGNDYTAKEFLETATASPDWRGLLEGPNLQRFDLPEADHTFSSQQWRNSVENACLDWLKRNE
ncbi:MAG: hydrolase 1, exosortase A system-associated [Rhodocyclaceae bacterium]|jgi:exosortase A-associated hydrolase 1|nr:hydrolase 1, exosortase A system-associated [Rhodocyclaceae bacterium]